MKHYCISQILLIAFMGLFILCGCSTYHAGIYRTGLETGVPGYGGDESVKEPGDIMQDHDGMSIRKMFSIIAPLAAMPYTVVPLAITVNSGVSLAGDMVSRPFKGSPEVPQEEDRQVELVAVDRAVDGD